MAKTRRKATNSPRRSWAFALVALAAILGAALFVYRAPIVGYAGAGTAYSARVACSCRFVSGRSLGDCAKDQLAGMELVMLSEDEEAKSVTATFPLVTRDTAVFRSGYGCVLQPWDR